MSAREEVTLPATRRPKSRKSLAHVPSAQTLDQENMTADLGALTGKRGLPIDKPRKSRSKSIGPGGLDALKDTAGNRRKVCHSISAMEHKTNSSQVSSRGSSSSSKINSQTYHATSPRNSGAYIQKEKSEENYPASRPTIGFVDRLQRGQWTNNHRYREPTEPIPHWRQPCG